MAELILFAIPSIIYLCVLGRRTRLGWGPAARRLGLAWGSGSDYVWAAGLLIPLVALGYAAIALIPDSTLQMPGVSMAAVTSVGAVAAVAARALGEEILFRGLIAGVLIRRLGFALGNALQAIVFLIPHLLLLLIDPMTWPVLPVQLLVGWLLGWLRHRSGSILPGAVIHVAANLSAGLLAA